MKSVLDVGQCDPDHATICDYLANFCDVQVSRAHTLEDTLAVLRERRFDLVLVNRKLDVDYSDGLTIIRAMKAEETLRSIPVMLVTNYPEHQDQAVAVGALRGFGKLEYDKPETKERLAAALQAPAS